ncbi:MAG: Hpt domain-containing protein [Candidatus Tectomicrobia bacterium]|uniref:Hpt domain-containing protein n=1 Tax=Tectimicrobiota bacterium TaxID=2528274 RepID=A0A938B6T3_UNCTE|nr:Hpt domain-containing protein [Candidatus Tectomicrobia bacterium]
MVSVLGPASAQAPEAASGLGAAPSLPTASDYTTLDMGKFAEVQELFADADPQGLHDILVEFLQDTAVRLDMLRRAAETCNTVALGRTAHALKSSSASMGALRMARLCEELLIVAERGVCRRASELVEQLGSHFLQVQMEMAQVCQATGIMLSPGAVHASGCNTKP